MNKSINNSDIKTGKIMAIVAHLSILGCIIAIFMNIEPRNKYAGFYIKQSFGLQLFFYAVAAVIGGFDSYLISIPFYVCFIVLWVYSFIGAVSEKINILPGVGTYFQKWFDKLSA